MIVSIRNDILADAIHSHTGQTIELSVTVAVLTKLFHINAIRIEHLDTGKEWAQMRLNDFFS